MSSDVYLCFEPKSENSFKDRIRIGHLGLMCYFGFDLMEALRTLHLATRGVVTPWLPDAAEAIVETYRASVREDDRSDSEWFESRYGYSKPTDWEDAPEAGELLGDFQENIGKHWHIGVD